MNDTKNFKEDSDEEMIDQINELDLEDLDSGSEKESLTSSNGKSASKN